MKGCGYDRIDRFHKNKAGFTAVYSQSEQRVIMMISLTIRLKRWMNCIHRLKHLLIPLKHFRTSGSKNNLNSSFLI